MTPQELVSTLKQLHEAATPEPWVNEFSPNQYGGGISATRSKEYYIIEPGQVGDDGWYERDVKDQSLIATLRNELPRIIRLLEAGETLAKSVDVYNKSPLELAPSIRRALSAYGEAWK